jgi:hypothetical protein
MTSPSVSVAFERYREVVTFIEIMRSRRWIEFGIYGQISDIARKVPSNLGVEVVSTVVVIFTSFFPLERISGVKKV